MRDEFDVAVTDTPPLARTIEAAANRVGMKVIDTDWAAWVSRVDALWMDARLDWWPDDRRGGPAFIFYRGLSAYGVNSGLPPVLSFVKATEEFRADGGAPNLIPCLRITTDADCYCFTPDGALVRWSHEGEPREPVHVGFLELVERELHELRERGAMARKFFGTTK
jgi:hypothetical protein